jgi:hypothetical protein
LQISDKRPPLVRFEEREYGINQEATERAGRPVPNVVPFALITPFGSKDVVEKVAVEWIAQIKRQAMQGSYPHEWAQQYAHQFEQWQKGNEVPRDGTPVKTWQAISREQQVRLIALGFTVIEDLAQCPDSGLDMIGLDGRYLRDLARKWSDTDTAAVIKRAADLEARVLEQQETIARMAEQLEQLSQAQKRGPGRPRREEAEAA